MNRNSIKLNARRKTRRTRKVAAPKPKPFRWRQADGREVTPRQMSDQHLFNALGVAVRLSAAAKRRMGELESARDTEFVGWLGLVHTTRIRIRYYSTAVERLQQEMERRAEAELLDECCVGGMDRYGSLQP